MFHVEHFLATTCGDGTVVFQLGGTAIHFHGDSIRLLIVSDYRQGAILNSLRERSSVSENTGGSHRGNGSSAEKSYEPVFHVEHLV